MKKIISLCLILCLTVLSLSACGKKTEKYHVNELSFEGNQVVAKPSDAYYKEDGSFCVKFGICNKSDGAKKVTAITSEVWDKDQRIITEKQEFKLQDPKILAVDEVDYVECIYAKDFVKLKADLESFKYRANITFESAVKEKSDPESSANKITMKVSEASFNDTSSLTGQLKLKNNFKKDITLSKITISAIKTDTGKVITKQGFAIDNTSTMKAGAVLAVPFLIAPSNLLDKVEDYKTFKNLIVEYTISTK